MKIPLTQGLETIVDDEDYLIVSKYEWHASYKGKGKIYACTTIDDPSTKSGRNTILMHRLLMSAPKGVKIDHVDGNGLNNQKYNLRLASSSQNN